MTYRDQCIVGDPKVVRGVIKDWRGRMGVFIWLRALNQPTHPLPSPISHLLRSPSLFQLPLITGWAKKVDMKGFQKSGHSIVK